MIYKKQEIYALSEAGLADFVDEREKLFECDGTENVKYTICDNNALFKKDNYYVGEKHER